MHKMAGKGSGLCCANDTNEFALSFLFGVCLCAGSMTGANGPPPNIAGMTSLKVDNLTFRTTIDDIRPLFDRYGEVGDIYIPRDRFTRESRGFAFVRYYSHRAADEALNKLDGYRFDGREIRVQLARYSRPSHPPGFARRSSSRRGR